MFVPFALILRHALQVASLTACAVPHSLDDDMIEGMEEMGGGKWDGRAFLMTALLCVGVVQEACAKRVVRGRASLMATLFLLAFLEGFEVSVLDTGVVGGVLDVEGVRNVGGVPDVRNVGVVEGVPDVEGVMDVGVLGGAETFWGHYDYVEGGVSLDFALVSLLLETSLYAV